jgi:hypothetical protein
MLQISDDQSRLIGLLWDKLIAEQSGDLGLALAIAQTIVTHTNELRARIGDEPYGQLLMDTKVTFDALWDIHGCGCGNPECPNNKSGEGGGSHGFDFSSLLQ